MVMTISGDTHLNMRKLVHRQEYQNTKKDVGTGIGPVKEIGAMLLEFLAPDEAGLLAQTFYADAVTADWKGMEMLSAKYG